MARDRKKPQAADRRRPIKKKVSILSSESINWIDYKDVNLLRRFMSERAKIRARRVTGNSAQQQRAVAKAIRLAREMALLPYSVRQVTQRSKGGRRGDRDRYSDGPPRDTEAPRAEPTEGPPSGGPPSEGEVVEGATPATNGDGVAAPEAAPDAPVTEASETPAAVEVSE
jgi:small subunit ribosomal protein S18